MLLAAEGGPSCSLFLRVGECLLDTLGSLRRRLPRASFLFQVFLLGLRLVVSRLCPWIWGAVFEVFFSILSQLGWGSEVATMCMLDPQLLG